MREIGLENGVTLRQGTGYPIFLGGEENGKNVYFELDTGSDRYMRDIQFSHDLWITQGFAKSKNRFIEDTDITAVRLLGDFRYLNAATEPPPAHFFHLCPDHRCITLNIPLGCTHFRYYDISDAYHTCNLSEATKRLVVVDFNGRLVQYLGGAQGISQMAVFWNVHLYDGFYRVLGRHWEHWFTGYVDDFGLFAETEQQAIYRDRILTCLLKTLGKPFSCKTANDFDDHMILAGLYIDQHGVRVEDLAVDNLVHALTKYEVKNIKDAQHVIGVIQHTNTAFYMG